MIQISILLLGLGSFFFLCYRILKSNYFSLGPTGDASAYFFCFSEWKYSLDRCLLGIGKNHIFPSTFFYSVYFIPDRFLENYPFFLNFFYSFLFTSLFWAITQKTFSLDFLLYFGIFLIFMDFSNFKPHKILYFAFSPRYFYMISNSFLLALFLIEDNSIAKIAFSIIFVSNCIYGSHFSRQFLFLIFLPFLVFYDLNYLIIILLFLVLIFISSKSIRDTFLSQIHTFKMQISRFSRHNKSGRLRNLFSFTFFEDFIPAINTLLVLSLSFFFGYKEVLLISIISISIFAITSLKRFEFLGESWRYLPYLNLIILSFLMLKLFHFNFFIFAIFLTLKLIYNLFLLIKLPAKPINMSPINYYVDDLLKDFKNDMRNSNFFSQDFRLGTIAINLGYGKKTCEYPIGRLGEIEEFKRDYPYLDYKLFKDNIIEGKNIKINYSIISNDYISKLDSNFKEDFSLIKNNEKLSLYIKNDKQR
tara:strand:+ start:29 stop:1453 length:1425 start_codon:yes stop_codon:yes gene_type:complete